MKDPMNLLWMDLEMTGLDPETDTIMEIATSRPFASALAMGIILRKCGIFNEDIVESTRENKPGDCVSPVHGAVDIFASNDQSILPAHLLMWVYGDH